MASARDRILAVMAIYYSAVLAVTAIYFFTFLCMASRPIGLPLVAIARSATNAKIQYPDGDE